MSRRNGFATAPPWTVAVAVGGVVLGHGVTYVVLQPDGHTRAGLLARTGHAYLHLLDGPALLLALVAVTWWFLSRLTHRVTQPGAPVSFAGLATFQVTAFAGMEIIERVAAGAPLAGLLNGGLLNGGLLAIGVTSQLLVAASLMWMLRRLPTLAAHVAAVLATAVPPLRRPALVSVSGAMLAPTLAAGRRAEPIRGPPPLPV